MKGVLKGMVSVLGSVSWLRFGGRTDTDWFGE